MILNALLLGSGLAMDASAVGMANGLIEPKMRKRKLILIATFFGVFQGLMPLLGYAFGYLFANLITSIVPYLALIILSILGIKMFIEGFKKEEEKQEPISIKGILLQAIATSIDAFAVGVLYVATPFGESILTFIIITVTTFLFVVIAIILGKTIGNKLSQSALIFGGVVLILVGIKIFIETI